MKLILLKSVILAIVFLSPAAVQADTEYTFSWSGTVSAISSDPLGLDGKPFTVSATVSDAATDNAAAVDVASFIPVDATVLFDGVAVDSVTSANLRFTDDTSAPTVDRMSLEVSVVYSGFSFTFTSIATLTDDSWTFTQVAESLPIISSGTMAASVSAFSVGYEFSTTIGSPYTVTTDTPSVLDLIEELGDHVVATNLQHGIENALDSKLDAAADAWVSVLDGSTRQDVINKLESFINNVMAQSGKKIDAGDADALIAEAEFIISVIANLE